MKVLTIGGGFVADHLPYQVVSDRVPLSTEHIDSILSKHKPDVIINCIGKTGRPNIDWCESNKEVTAATNTALPILLAEVCAKKDIHLVQIGSGCIYFGESPNFVLTKTDGTVLAQEDFRAHVGQKVQRLDLGWKEDDFANPKSFYSKTKYACDLMLGGMKHVTTLRIRMPISVKNNQRNLINKLRGYKQVIDIPNSVTFMDDLARCISWAVENTKTGIYHVTNPAPITAAQVMREYQKYVPDHKFEIISEEQLDNLTVAKRSNCLINSDKLKAAGFVMTPSEIALKRTMDEYIRNL